ncbi:MAG: AmmeMemoRadiSam system radical SAM enzyme [Spirochaetes bacterium]|nr:AmmeMemoRadiSam system radical SAM enzyme [Spirochaetota bacterium]
MMKESIYFQVVDQNYVQCLLCPHLCKIKEGDFGKCKTRSNIGNKIYSMYYGMVSSIAMDPIEKKPLYHFYPGEKILSIGTAGCNFNCLFCQNYSISQNTNIPLKFIPKEEVKKILIENNCNLLAFTYSEPLIWYETIYDYSKYLKEELEDIKIVLVTNGYINIKPLESLIKYIDAANVDLKSYSESFYKEICGGTLEPVKNFIKYTFSKIHIEITTLVIPGKNDSEEEIENIAKFIFSLSADIPLHLSRYFPQYKMSIPPTNTDKIVRLADICKKYLKYVYTGNFYGGYEDTICPNCKSLLIERKGFFSKVLGLDGNLCKHCGNKINIVI